MRKQILSLVTATAILFIVTGCADLMEPRMFGIPKTQWDTLNVAQQQEVIRGFYKVKKTEAQVAPINSALETTKYIYNHRNMN